MTRRIAKGLSAVCLALAMTAGSASASGITFTATGTGTDSDLSASVNFDLVGGALQVTLTNTSTYDVLAPADVLTAVFFDFTPLVTLTTTSATVASGSTVYFGPTDPGGVVGGEFGYATGLSGAPASAGLGVSSSGLGLFGPSDLFPGTNLQGPESPDGIQYGITSAGDNLATGNAAVTGANALIKNSVVFVLSGDFSGLTIEDLSFSNVSFQYGTGLDEPNISVPDGGSTISLLGLAMLGVGFARRKLAGRLG